jgi:hypothetical protein
MPLGVVVSVKSRIETAVALLRFRMSRIRAHELGSPVKRLKRPELNAIGLEMYLYLR